MQSYREFSSYKGLDRTALFMGVPLLPAVALLTLAVFIMLVGMHYFGLLGAMFMIIVLPIGFFLKTISETDDKAMDMLALEVRYRLKRVAYREFGDTLTYLPERYLRYQPSNEEAFKFIKDDE